MPEFFYCPYLGGEVEVTDERYAHVVDSHADFALAYWTRAGETIQGPDRVIRRKQDGGAVMFYRWYDDIGKHVVVVVRRDSNRRHWLVTAYMTRDIARGELLWVKS